MKHHLALIVVAVAAVAAGTAFAQTKLQASVPTDHATIDAAPQHVELTFSEPVRLTALSIQRDGEQKQSLGPLPSETTTTFSVGLPTPISDGHYAVAWRALSGSTQIVSGEFMFAVGAKVSHDAHMNHVNMPAGEEPAR